MLGFTLAAVTLLSVGLYVSAAHAFKFLKSSSVSSFSWSAHDSETTQQTYQLSPAGSVSVSTTNGEITVTTHNKSEVLVKITKEGDKNDFNFVTTEIKNDQDTLSLEAVYKKNNCRAAVSYELVVPEKASVTLETINGSVSVTGVTGGVQAQSSNGALNFEQTPALSYAQTVNGRIKVVADTLIFGGKTVHLQTTNGSIFLAARAIASGAFSIRTVNGSITLALPELPGTYGRRSASFSIPATGTGSASFDIQTVNGSISLTKFSK